MEWEPGAALPDLTVTPDRGLPVRYAGASGDFNPVHVDDEFARAVGLPGRILHGLYMMALVARAATEAGGGPAALQRLSVELCGTGVPEAEITVSATVRAVTAERVTLDATATQDGVAIIRRGEVELRR